MTVSYFYFTEQDPDYRPKGSRDPLGFQVIWQSMARNVIPSLSTVSSNISDFLILGLSRYLLNNNKNFVKTFFKIEQLFGYARVFEGNEKSERFNGIEEVNKKWKNRDTEIIYLSEEKENLILSDQKTYGILGKYTRPFNDISFYKSETFEKIIKTKLEQLTKLKSFLEEIQKSNLKVKICDNETLKECAEFLKLDNQEREFFRRELLSKEDLSEKTKLQPKIYNYLKKSRENQKQELNNKNFYKITEDIYNTLEESSEKESISNIIRTELILSRLSILFSHIQSYETGIITKERVNEDKEIFEKIRLSNSETGQKYNLPKEKFKKEGEVDKRLNNYIEILESNDPWLITEKLVDINKRISERRKTYPWITKESDYFKVHLKDGAEKCIDFNPKEEIVFNRYFLDTYVSLFNQLNP